MAKMNLKAIIAVLVLAPSITTFGYAAATSPNPLSPRCIINCGPACVDIFADPGYQNPIRLNFCHNQGQCVGWNDAFGSIKFEGTCCHYYTDSNCDTASENVALCSDGDLPEYWRAKGKILSYQCWLPSIFDNLKRDTGYTIAAPAKKLVERDTGLNANSDLACVDIFADPGYQTPIQLNFCHRQREWVGWNDWTTEIFAFSPWPMTFGSIKFKGTCCKFSPRLDEDCNDSSTRANCFTMCDPGDLPDSWRSAGQVQKFSCWLPDAFKRDVSNTIDASTEELVEEDTGIDATSTIRLHPTNTFFHTVEPSMFTSRESATTIAFETITFVIPERFETHRTVTRTSTITIVHSLPTTFAISTFVVPIA
jgi:hypothetical protein